jgi:hypothetical protein
LGTGWNFDPGPYNRLNAPTSLPLRYGEYEPYEKAVSRAINIAYPQPQQESWLWDLEVRMLASKERRDCKVCVDGVETANGVKQECRACKGHGTLPLHVGQWLCNVNQETGEYYPRYFPMRGNKPCKPNTRSWRTKDGKDKNRPMSVTRLTPQTTRAR